MPIELMTTKIAWAKILGLLGVTGSGGVGAGYGATKYSLEKVIHQLEEEYDNMEQSITEKAETIDQLEKDLTKEKALTRQQDTELVGLRANLKTRTQMIETLQADSHKREAEHAQTLASVSSKLSAIERDVDYFIQQVTQWVRQNKQRNPRCN